MKLMQPREGASGVSVEKKKLLTMTEKLMKIIIVEKLNSKKQ